MWFDGTSYSMCQSTIKTENTLCHYVNNRVFLSLFISLIVLLFNIHIPSAYITSCLHYFSITSASHTMWELWVFCFVHKSISFLSFYSVSVEPHHWSVLHLYNLKFLMQNYFTGLQRLIQWQTYLWTSLCKHKIFSDLNLIEHIKIKVTVCDCDMNIFVCLSLQMLWLIPLQQRVWVTLESLHCLPHTLRWLSSLIHSHSSLYLLLLCARCGSLSLICWSADRFVLLSG